eukprot:1194233-Amphidinium_carterae.1
MGGVHPLLTAPALAASKWCLVASAIDAIDFPGSELMEADGAADVVIEQTLLHQARGVGEGAAPNLLGQPACRPHLGDWGSGRALEAAAVVEQ